jgi:putative MATE family efflux protein
LKKVDTKKLTLFALTWPLFIEIFLHTLMGNADTLMLSHYSDQSVAAVGLSNQILYFIIVMFGFIAIGSSIVVSQYLGANQEKTAGEVATLSIFLNLLFGLFLSIILFVFGETFLVWMNCPEEILPEALSYMRIVGVFSFIQAFIMTLGTVIRSYGYTKDAMYVTLGMNVINIIGNYLFIFGPFEIPVLGVTGVAYSTVASRLIGAIVLVFIFTKRTGCTITIKDMIPLPKQHINNLLKIGIPAAGEQLAYYFSQMVILYFVTLLGTEAITTKVYVENLMWIIHLMAVAIGEGTQILVGNLVGAKKFGSAFSVGLKSLKLAIVSTVVFSIVFSLLSKQLLSIFTDNQEIIALGSILIFFTLILEPGRSFNLVFVGSLRAAGDAKFPVFVGILSMWGVSVTLAYLLGITFGLGLVGIWIAFIVDEWLRGLIMLRRWRSRKWEQMRLVA